MTSCKSLVIATLLVACTSSTVPTVRFHNAPPVTVVDDRRDTPIEPANRPFNRSLYHMRGNVVRPIKRSLDVVRDRRALGVNALDEVPNSTWFTNRIGVREVTLDEMRDGPGAIGTPELHKPWTVVSTKVGGANIGFIIKDNRGQKFILKFDKVGHPETETAAGVITGRLLWAMGWNVPEEHIVYFKAGDLVLAKDAKVKDVFGHSRKLDRTELESMLARVDVAADGRIRSLASAFLDGKPLGGHLGDGTRKDDPNDRIPQELRRDLRGSYAMFSWLDHTDIKEDNTLDMLVKDPADPERRYVKHYQIDFGNALGTYPLASGNPRVGHAYVFDLGSALGSLASLGLYERSWEGRERPNLPGVGLYDVERYDPGNWKANTASYLPMHTADRIDNFWGSKILMRFTRAQLRTAVLAGRLSDPRSVDYLTDMLVARQRATARYWFDRTAPLDRIEVEEITGGHVVCFDDLMLTYQLPTAPTRYQTATFDRDGKPLAAHAAFTPMREGRTCTAPIEMTDGDGYTIVEITTHRSGRALATHVHVARNQGAARVIGIWRK
jgi:hypothetical protein